MNEAEKKELLVGKKNGIPEKTRIFKKNLHIRFPYAILNELFIGM